jgi:zona occludens toxin
MPIYARTGLQRSGKSYESVKTDILGAIIAGIDVRAYIDGLQYDLIREYAAKISKKPLEDIGHIYPLTRAEVESPRLFPRVIDGVVHDADSIVKAGDRTIIDECRKFYSKGMKILPQHQEFFREHGHICHPVTGVNCDLILISQSISDFDPSIRCVIERTFRTKKLNAMGLNSRYSLEIFFGGSTAFKDREDIITPNKYDKSIFPLYKSASNDKAVQSSLDKRTNVLANPRFLLLMLVAIGGLGYAFYYLGNLYSGNSVKKPDASLPSSKPAAVRAVGAVVTPGLSGTGVSTGAGAPSRALAADYRLSGFYTAGDANYAIVEYADASGACHVRYMTIGAGSTLDGPRSSVVVDGRNVATYNSSPCSRVKKSDMLGGLK